MRLPAEQLCATSRGHQIDNPLPWQLRPNKVSIYVHAMAKAKSWRLNNTLPIDLCKFRDPRKPCFPSTLVKKYTGSRAKYKSYANVWAYNTVCAGESFSQPSFWTSPLHSDQGSASSQNAADADASHYPQIWRHTSLRRGPTWISARFQERNVPG